MNDFLLHIVAVIWADTPKSAGKNRFNDVLKYLKYEPEFNLHIIWEIFLKSADKISDITTLIWQLCSVEAVQSSMRLH